MELIASNSTPLVDYMDVVRNLTDVVTTLTPPGGAFPGRPPPPPGPPPGAPPPPPGGPPPNLNYEQPRTIYFVSLGIVIPLGFICNILSFVVFATSRKLRSTTTGHYLLALAVADTLFLVGEFIRWLNPPGKEHLGILIDFLDRIDSLCKIIMWLRYGAKLASAWITVVITVERFITVAFPLKVMRISTPRIAKIVIGIVFAVSFAAGSFPMWTVGVEPFGKTLICMVTDKPMYNTLNWVFLRSGSLFIPGVMIVVFCVLIAVYLGRAKKVRTRKLSTNSVTSSGSRTSSRKFERQLTLMLLAVSVAFILLRLPYTVSYYMYVYRKEIYGASIDHYTTYRLLYVMKMTDIFVSINYGINFFLYCFCGSSFRKQLKRLFRCRTAPERRRSRDTASSFMSSRNGSMRSDHVKHVELSSNGYKHSLNLTSMKVNDRKM